MNSHELNIQGVKDSLDELIIAGTTFNIDALEKIYHEDLQVTMIDSDGNVSNADKFAFKSLFEAKKREGSAPLNTWSKLHKIDASDNDAYVLISRKVSLADQEQDLTLSIDLVKVEKQWQVIREVIFVQPLSLN
jgi:hypothetical protein